MTVAGQEPGDGPPDGRLVRHRESSIRREPVARTWDVYDSGYADWREESQLREYWRIVSHRRGLIAGIVAACVALGLMRALMMTPIYTATVRLQIERNAVQIVEGGNVTPIEAGHDHEFQRTQYELLQSRAMAERVVLALNLGADANFATSGGWALSHIAALLFGPAASEKSAAGGPDPRRSAVDVLLLNRTVRPVSGARLVDINYSDPDPARAERIANAFADAFIASGLDRRFQANAYAKAFLEDQIRQLKLRLEDSERILLEFAEREQIVSVAEKSSIAESNLASANAALGVLVSERIRNEQLWRQVEAADAIALPQLLSNAIVEGLRSKRNALASEYQEKLQTFKPGFPGMIQLATRIAEIDRQLTVEMHVIRDALKAAFDASLEQEAAMRERIELLRAELLDFQKRSIRHNILKREVDTNRGLYDGLLQRFKEVDIAGGSGANNIFIVDRAERPLRPSSPRLGQTLVVSLSLGLGVGLASAFLLARLDDAVRSVEDLEQETARPALGVVPLAAGGATAEEELADTRSGLAEAYRSVCTSLQFSSENGLPRTLLITSTGPGEGKSITALAIARHFASAGMQVLLVDADLRNPSMHAKLGLFGTPGLSNYLSGACTPPEAFQETDVASLTFMASGPLPPSAADLLGGQRFASLLSVGQQVFDLIVIDGPPVMGLADAPILSNAASATVLVVAAGQSRKGDVRDAVRRLDRARGAVIGAVLTKVAAARDGYGYAYGYGYGYGYGDRRGHGAGGRIGPSDGRPRLGQTA